MADGEIFVRKVDFRMIHNGVPKIRYFLLHTRSMMGNQMAIL